MDRNYKKLIRFILILIIGVYFILLYLRYGQSIQLAPDAKLYYDISQAILKGSSETEAGNDIGKIIMPGFPAILAGFFALFGNKLIYFIIFQTTIAAISIYIFFEIINNIIKTNPIVALIFTLLLLGYYPLWRLSFTTMKEVITVILLIGLIPLIHLMIKKGKVKHIVIFYIYTAILVAVMNRFIFHIFVLTLISGIFLVYFKGYRKIKFKHLFISGFIFLFILTPWHYRQYKTYDKIVLFSPIRTENTKSSSDNSKSLRTYQEVKDRLMESGFSNYRKKRVKKNFSRELYDSLAREYKNRSSLDVYFSRLKGFFTVYEDDFRFGYGTDKRISPPASIFNRLANLLSFGIPFILLIPALYYSIVRRNYFIIFLFILFFAHIFLHVYVHYIHRYRTTILPIVITIASWSFCIISQKIKFNILKRTL